MQLRCSSGHVWEFLPNFPDTKPCPECGACGGADIESKGRIAINAGMEQDPDRMDPLEVQFWQEHRAHHEDLILSGDRGSGAYIVSEKGPDWARPFGNSDFERRRAIAERGYSKSGY